MGFGGQSSTKVPYEYDKVQGVYLDTSNCADDCIDCSSAPRRSRSDTHTGHGNMAWCMEHAPTFDSIFPLAPPSRQPYPYLSPGSFTSPSRLESLLSSGLRMRDVAGHKGR